MEEFSLILELTPTRTITGQQLSYTENLLISIIEKITFENDDGPEVTEEGLTGFEIRQAHAESGRVEDMITFNPKFGFRNHVALIDNIERNDMQIHFHLSVRHWTKFNIRIQ